MVFRILGIPSLATVTALGDVLAEEFLTEGITINTKKTTLAPSCYSDGTQIALVQFTPNAPAALLALSNGTGYDIEFGNTGEAIFVDKDFYGLTPLYETTEGKIKLDIIAVSGLDGHAYGSWRGRSNLRLMWLRHFLGQDFPNCRTMTYGYNSKLTAAAIHSTADFTKSFLEELEKARSTEEERTRPIVFIGHRFGGIIIAQALVKAKENEEVHADLFRSTRATIFFGTPHRGLLVDDILAMAGDNSPRASLVKSIAGGSDVLAIELARFVDYSTGIKIISFYETSQIQKLVKGPDGRWSRSGDFFTSVESSSSVLHLPRTIENSIPAEGDHSNMVKFTHKRQPSYTSVVRHLRKFVENENLVTPLQAVESSDTDALARIFRSNKHVQVNRRYPPDLRTLLHKAVANHDKACVAILVANGIDMNTLDEAVSPALYLAIEMGDEEMLVMLLDNGAEIAVAGAKSGMTALHVAAKFGHAKMTEVLLDHGANIKAKAESGYLAHNFAAENGHDKVIQVLFKHEALLSEPSLHYAWIYHAIANDDEKIVELILDNAANMGKVLSSGELRLEMACLRGSLKVVQLYLKRGLFPGGRELSSYITIANGNGHKDVVALLKAEKGDDCTIS